MGYVIAFLGVTGTVIAAFIAGWIVGPRVISPIAGKIVSALQGAAPQK